MGAYLARRLLQALTTLLIMSVVVFALARVTGDPTHLLVDASAPAEEVARVRALYGLDQPMHVQYFRYMGEVLQGNLGRSFRAGRPVASLIAEQLPNTLKLAVAALALTVVLAIPLGVTAAVKRGTWIDTTCQLAAVLGQSVPGFWLGIVLVVVFAVNLRWLPAAGTGGPEHFVLPTVTLAVWGVASVMRLLRSSMLEVLVSDYIRVAQAKGLATRAILYRHALRNSLIPVVSLLGILFATLLSGTVVVENVFAWPGIGTLAYNAILWRDFPLMQGLLLGMIFSVIVITILVDVLYMYIDPRLRPG